MTPSEKLAKANLDYHEAVDEVLSDTKTIADVELRAEIKSRFGSATNGVFRHMEHANSLIAKYYEVE